MSANILKTLENLLKTSKKYFSSDGKILKAAVQSDVLALNKDLIKLLLSNESIKEIFFAKINDVLVFDKQKFAWFINSREFLPDSFTSYANKIGLNYGGGIM